MKGFNSISTFAFLTLFFCNTYAQNPSGDQIRIKIDANVDGKAVTIDTSVNDLSDLNIQEILGELGLTDDLGQLNIDINSGFDFHYNFDEKAMEDLMQGLGDLEMPAIPPMPPMPEMPVNPSGDSWSYSGSNKALLGVYTDNDQEGAKISEVMENSAALEGGLKQGDIITKIDDRTVESPDNLSEVIGRYEPGAAVTVTYLREGKTYTTNVVLKENEDYNAGSYSYSFEFPDTFNIQRDSAGFSKIFNVESSSRGYLGVYLDDADGKVLVNGVDEKSAAEAAGLKEGDIIKSINGKAITSYDEVMSIMETTRPGDKIKIEYERGGKTISTEASLGEMKSGFNYFNMDSGENENTPGIIIDKVAPCMPGSSFSYNSGDGKKNINICITTVKKGDMPSAASPAQLSEHPLMNPDNLKVFSNPSDGKFVVQFNLPEEGDTGITITDINGKEVYTETIKNFSGDYNKTISISDKPKGTYFVKVTQNGYSSTRSVVVQ